MTQEIYQKFGPDEGAVLQINIQNLQPLFGENCGITAKDECATIS